MTEFAPSSVRMTVLPLPLMELMLVAPVEILPVVVLTSWPPPALAAGRDGLVGGVHGEQAAAERLHHQRIRADFQVGGRGAVGRNGLGVEHEREAARGRVDGEDGDGAVAVAARASTCRARTDSRCWSRTASTWAGSPGCGSVLGQVREPSPPTRKLDDAGVSCCWRSACRRCPD